MVINLGKLQILGERKRTTGILVNPSYGNGYVADVLVGDKYIYILHSSMSYVSQYNKLADGSVGTRVRTTNWYDMDTYIGYICANNSSVPYGYAMYVKDGKDFLVGWSASHNSLFEWEINTATNGVINRKQYNVCNQTMASYSRGGWDGGRYVYFYNRNDRGIYRWDIENKTAQQVKIVTLSGFQMSSSFTGSGMLVDTAAGEIYMGSGNNDAQGFLGVWSLATGAPLAGTPRNPIKAADLTGIGVSNISGESGNISLSGLDRSVAYYTFTYTGVVVELNVNGLKTPPSNIKAHPADRFLMTDETCTVTWDAATRYMGTDKILYRLDVNYNGTWETIATDLEDLEYTYTIPSDTPHSAVTKYRVSARLDGHPNYYLSTNNQGVSPNNIIYRHLFLVKADDKTYTFTDGDWEEVVDNVDNDKDNFIKKGIPELDYIPSAKWDELGDFVSVIAYGNNNTDPILDITSQEGQTPLDLLREKLNYPEVTVRSYVDNSSALSLNRVAVPQRQIIFPTEDIKLFSPTVPEAVTGFNLVANQSEGTKMKVMFSIDKGNTYLSWNGTKWISYMNIADNEQAEDLMEVHGMSVSTLNSLTREQLGEVFGYHAGHRIVRFVYLYESNNVNDILESGELKVTMDMHGSWRQAKESDYTYGYPTNRELQVQLFTPGSYKINGLLEGDKMNDEQEE